MKKNFYDELGIEKNATKNEIKSSYRSLVKKHHPDKGGQKERFLAIQNAWETLNDPIKKEKYDREIFSSNTLLDSLNENWEEKFNSKKYNSSIKDKEVEAWIKEIYNPINRLISQIIKPLNNEIKELSADPYDDQLMENFCSYINISQKKIEKVDKIYNKKIVPKSISALGLNLYHCFSQVKDALLEFDRYTQGYVDDYLFDGKEMIKEAKRIQSKMALETKNKNF
ncbi:MULTISPECIES: J domain-containing protein [Prochlorococcus]|uniref:Putative heat shock protein DnaJ n=1 Tax=Prochlorococcus marinus str. MIT 9116 TaxID=167544 RepID=A0A0A1ZNJ1_PROMR|nr:DnaJ domain-containing protein [Prochlorococcus marinus]KGF89290.1 putative heat shock protein DnaJ [Prochlorococcus marinus str. MIT 9107]KGF90046.1 putative heat shock protein DnaJ [Prochlorococcus marinus str. MIT 9116]KGF95482.1 putative heat shock protein DnaJ [Prochlorococcus marinus str. MIT 9123]